MLKVIVVLAVIGLLMTGCSNTSDKGAEPRRDPSVSGAVVYGIGVSTDPYGSSARLGFGVASRLGEDDFAKVEVRGNSWCPERASWLGREGCSFRSGVRKALALAK